MCEAWGSVPRTIKENIDARSLEKNSKREQIARKKIHYYTLCVLM
jgi:hypothetical protein